MTANIKEIILQISCINIMWHDYDGINEGVLIYSILFHFSYIFSQNLTSIGAKSPFSRSAVVKVVDQLELFIHLQWRS